MTEVEGCGAAVPRFKAEKYRCHTVFLSPAPPINPKLRVISGTCQRISSTEPSSKGTSRGVDSLISGTVDLSALAFGGLVSVRGRNGVSSAALRFEALRNFRSVLPELCLD